ncbi:hypothetical protein AAC387_Pa11g1277 [Persea americana]
MDKSWIHKSRASAAYKAGVQQFLDFAFANAISSDRIKCPCKNCSNIYYRSRDEVYEHLICDGVDKGYARGVWVFHGELASLRQISRNVTLDEDVSDEVDAMHGMLQLAFGTQDPKFGAHETEEGPNVEAERQTINHTAGTRSFAQIREEERQLNERVSQQSESSRHSTFRNDISTQVMGEDIHGQTRTFGLCVAPSDIYGPQASTTEARRMAEAERAQRIVSEEMVVALREEMDQMKTRMNQIETLLQRFTDSGQPSSSSESVGFQCSS